MLRIFAEFRQVALRFATASEGNVALIFCLSVPVLVGIAGLGVDSAAVYDQQSRMQSVADSTALAVGKEMNLLVEDLEPLRQSGLARAEVLLDEVGLAERPHTVTISLDREQATSHVEIAMQTKTFLPVDVWGQSPIVVTAEANVLGIERLCVLSLDHRASRALELDKRAHVTAPDCYVQANSGHSDGLSARRLSLLLSSSSCTSGGYEGDSSVFVPLPETDCPALDDPLELRAPPAVGGCDFDRVEIDSAQSISPGHYCGGLTIKGNADVTAEPGTYIISGGQLQVRNNAKFHGEDVAFYFADDDSTFEFRNNAVVELSGPTGGPLAGVLFFEDHAARADREFRISSDSVRKLIGTIYLPRGIFRASAVDNGIQPAPGDPVKVIGAASTYTIIVANKIELDGVDLVINADYAGSDVPVPPGLGPQRTSVRLSR